MSPYRLMIALVLLVVALATSGCSALLGGLRKDLDDGEAQAQPTYGGRWTEQGLLADDMEKNPYPQRGLSRGSRGPASDLRANPQEGSWISDEQAEASRRDRTRNSNADEPIADNGESEQPAPPKQKFKRGDRATKADFIDTDTNEGSLWASDGQTNYFFTKNKVRGVGDIVTLQLEPEMIRDIGLEVGRSLSAKEKEVEIAIAQEKINGKSSGASADQVATSSAAPAKGTPAADAQQTGYNSQGAGSQSGDRKATTADIDVSKSIGIKAGDTMMAEIVERYPNGNFKVRGSKRVPYRNSTRLVNVVAIVKGTDISEEDTLGTGKLYEYRLEANR